MSCVPTSQISLTVQADPVPSWAGNVSHVLCPDSFRNHLLYDSAQWKRVGLAPVVLGAASDITGTSEPNAGLDCRLGRQQPWGRRAPIVPTAPSLIDLSRRRWTRGALDAHDENADQIEANHRRRKYRLVPWV